MPPPAVNPPLAQPAPYLPPPEEPVYPPQVFRWGSPSPGLSLVPGSDHPRWDVSVDALWLERDAGTSIPLGFTSYNYGSHAMQAIGTDSLWSDDVYFPLAAGLRLQVICRTSDETAIEVTGWGLQQWSVGRSIYGDPLGESVLAHSPWLAMSSLIGGFDNELGYTYNSQVANVEINQRRKLYSFDPYRAFSWLWGFRYFSLTDDFGLSGSDLYTGNYESLDWRTSNNLIGMQIGLQWAWGWDRFQLSTEVKGGLFANAYSQHGIDSGSPLAGFQPFDISHGGTDLAGLIELSLTARYRIAPNVWVRGGYQFYGLSGLALGPRQLGGYDDSGSVGLDGLSVGMEWTH